MKIYDFIKLGQGQISLIENGKLAFAEIGNVGTPVDKIIATGVTRMDTVWDRDYSRANEITIKPLIPADYQDGDTVNIAILVDGKTETVRGYIGQVWMNSDEVIIRVDDY